MVKKDKKLKMKTEHVLTCRVDETGVLGRVYDALKNKKCSKCGADGFLFNVEMFLSRRPKGYMGITWQKWKPLCLLHAMMELDKLEKGLSRPVAKAVGSAVGSQDGLCKGNGVAVADEDDL